jgi:hypothetical protein
MEIERGVPIPIAHRGGRRGAPVRDVVEKMAVGDSILFPTETSMSQTRQLIVKRGWKYTSRKTREGYRLWRTE